MNTTVFAVVTAETVTSQYINPLQPCPKQLWEIILGLIFALAIVCSNIACMKVVVQLKTQHHPENRYYVINLAVSNTLCGAALFVTNTLEIFVLFNQDKLNMDICYRMCQYWAPIFIYCVMVPYVALATLGLDIAYYCHHSMDYRRRMSKNKLWITIASCWIYTLIVVANTVGLRPQIVCDKEQWELDLHFIVLPILLMFFPAICVVSIFVHIMRNYWTTSRDLAKRMSISKISVTSDTKIRLVRKFVKKFSHLIVFSILCSTVYTVMTIAEAVLESQDHQRICALHRLDRVFITANSLLSPWIHYLATKTIRRRIKRKYIAWWRNSGKMTSIRLSHHTTRRDTKFSTDMGSHRIARRSDHKQDATDTPDSSPDIKQAGERYDGTSVNEPKQTLNLDEGDVILEAPAQTTLTGDEVKDAVVEDKN